MCFFHKLARFATFIVLVLVYAVGSLDLHAEQVSNVKTTDVSSPQSESGFLTTAEYAILVDYDTKQVLFEKNADVSMTPSSMSKIMTMYVVFEALKAGRISLTDKFLVSKKAWLTEGSKMFVKVGESALVEDLIHGVITQSGNDACIVLAENMFGSEEAMAVYMNEVARRLELTNTHFSNVTGLPEENHKSTARDLAMLTAALIKDFPEYYHYHQEKEFSYNNIVQTNRNELIGVGNIDGVKTGHTEEAGFGIVVSAKRNNMRLIGVLNGCKKNFQRKEAAANLMNYGFNNFEQKSLYDIGQKVATVNVIYGNVPEVGVAPNAKIIFIRPKWKKEQNFKVVATYMDSVTASIKAGQKMGDIRVLKDDAEVILTADLVAMKKIDRANFLQHLIQNIYLLFR